jgi:hypothetical protein
VVLLDDLRCLAGACDTYAETDAARLGRLVMFSELVEFRHS